MARVRPASQKQVDEFYRQLEDLKVENKSKNRIVELECENLRHGTTTNEQF